ncbi:MAG: hypothetical protein AB7F59_12170 [Bdellovibrionales bacterium]
MKTLFIFSLATLLTVPAFARNVVCYGRADTGNLVVVQLDRAAQYEIAGVTVEDVADNKVLARRTASVAYDRTYRPTARYARYQRYKVSRTNSVNLLLPLDKSGRYTAYVQLYSGAPYADTVTLDCSEF